MHTKAEPAAAAKPRPTQFRKTSSLVVNLYDAPFSMPELRKKKPRILPEQAPDRDGLKSIRLLLGWGSGCIVLLLAFNRIAVLFVLGGRHARSGLSFGLALGHDARGSMWEMVEWNNRGRTKRRGGVVGPSYNVWDPRTRKRFRPNNVRGASAPTGLPASRASLSRNNRPRPLMGMQPYTAAAIITAA